MQAVAERLLTITRKIRIAAPAEQVVHAWSGPLAIARWYVERRCGDALLDRPFAWYEPRRSEREPDREAAPPRTAHTLHFCNDGRIAGDTTELRVAIESGAAGTLVALDHGGFDHDRHAELPRIASSWTAALALLKAYVEDGALRARHTTEQAIAAPRRPGDFAHAVASIDAIETWSGDRPLGVHANSPHDAVLGFAGLPGLVSLHLGRHLVVSHTCWRDEPLPRAAALVARLAARLGRFVAVR